MENIHIFRIILIFLSLFSLSFQQTLPKYGVTFKYDPQNCKELTDPYQESQNNPQYDSSTYNQYSDSASYQLTVLPPGYGIVPQFYSVSYFIDPETESPFYYASLNALSGTSPQDGKLRYVDSVQAVHGGTRGGNFVFFANSIVEFYNNNNFTICIVKQISAKLEDFQYNEVDAFVSFPEQQTASSLGISLGDLDTFKRLIPDVRVRAQNYTIRHLPPDTTMPAAIPMPMNINDNITLSSPKNSNPINSPDFLPFVYPQTNNPISISGTNCKLATNQGQSIKQSASLFFAILASIAFLS